MLKQHVKPQKRKETKRKKKEKNQGEKNSGRYGEYLAIAKGSLRREKRAKAEAGEEAGDLEQPVKTLG